MADVFRRDRSTTVIMECNTCLQKHTCPGFVKDSLCNLSKLQHQNKLKVVRRPQ